MIRSRVDSRLPRPVPPRGDAPGRRPPAAPADPAAADRAWDLWQMRALFPDARPDDLARLLRARDDGLAREREALAGLWSGDRGDLVPGRSFLAARPDLTSGLVVSLHQGPYQLLPEPWLAAGCDPLVLIHAGAAARFARVGGRLSGRLGHRGRVEFLPVGPRGTLRRVVSALRGGRPVIVFLDGNGGEAPPRRDRALRYGLPGREVLLRTGVARLAVRLGVPLHPVAVAWEEGRVAWEQAPTLRPRRGDDPVALSRVLWDWLFSQVLRRPEQWHHWSLLRDACTCFAAGGLDTPRVPAGLREDFRRAFASCLERSPETVRMVLEREVEVWPGDVLADLTADRFYPAAGLADADLAPLRTGSPTLHELAVHHGAAWVRFHGLRLCLLGMARLGG